MQITQHPGAESLELRLTGRIDATWENIWAPPLRARYARVPIASSSTLRAWNTSARLGSAWCSRNTNC